MVRRSFGFCVGSLILGCATPAPLPRAAEPLAAAEGRAGASEPAASAGDVQLSPSAKRARAAARLREQPQAEEREVDVAGIEGTLTSYDVRSTLEQRAEDFGRCHEPRARSVPALAGTVEFAIRVTRTGRVGAVHVRASDLGDRVLERCLSEVIRSATFPKPRGGEADVTWSMLLEPAGTRQQPEQWESRRIERVLRKYQRALLETCDAKRSGPFTVTAYVSRRGRVLSAGVAAKRPTAADQLDCIAQGLRSWSMPKPRKPIAKVSFPLRTGA